MTSFQDWLVEAVDFYRELGFFQQHEELSTIELATRIRALLAEGTDESQFDPGDPGLDMALLSHDGRRAFMAGIDARAVPGSQVFIALLNNLADISRGLFFPQSCVEVWQRKVVRVRFLRGEQAHEATLPADGRIHRELILEANRSLEGTGCQFEIAEGLHDRSGELLFITLLGEEERFKIERERGLCFRIYDLARLLRPMHVLLEPVAAPHGTFLGTVNEFFDRSVGRLELFVAGDGISGGFLYVGRDHREELVFSGQLQGDRITGTIRGVVSAGGSEEAAYLGRWSGRVHQGGGILYGTWSGWMADMGESEPVEAYRGQWAAVSAPALASDDFHLVRVRRWLEEVWTASTPEDYPWMLP